MDDDFLWDCAMHSQSNSRVDIIPDYEDDMKHFCNDNLNKANIGSTFHLQGSTNITADELSVYITESRGNGVLDIIGGELWEGALLLCVFILQFQQVFVRPDVLELGSGVGLPGLLLAQLKANLISYMRGDVGDITLTDNDPRVVNNLNSSVLALGAGGNRITEQSKETPPLQDISHHAERDDSKESIALRTRILDWSVFNNHNKNINTGNTIPDPEQIEQQQQQQQQYPPIVEEMSNLCEVIMGCELCYAPYHAQCLAELLR